MYPRIVFFRRIAIAIVLLLCSAALGYLLSRKAASAAREKNAVSASQKPALPARLRIPSLGIDARIVPVGLTPAGAMDVPTRSDEAGWFSPGALPGQPGNAVLAGHLDTLADTRGIFWDLHRLQQGDDIEVRDASDHALHFRVRASNVYPVDAVPLRQVFGTASGSHLQLITCEGTWQTSLHRYDERLVVSADLAPSLTLRSSTQSIPQRPDAFRP